MSMRGASSAQNTVDPAALRPPASDHGDLSSSSGPSSFKRGERIAFNTASDPRAIVDAALGMPFEIKVNNVAELKVAREISKLAPEGTCTVVASRSVVLQLQREAQERAVSEVLQNDHKIPAHGAWHSVAPTRIEANHLHDPRRIFNEVAKLLSENKRVDLKIHDVHTLSRLDEYGLRDLARIYRKELNVLGSAQVHDTVTDFKQKAAAGITTLSGFAASKWDSKAFNSDRITFGKQPEALAIATPPPGLSTIIAKDGFISEASGTQAASTARIMANKIADTVLSFRALDLFRDPLQTWSDIKNSLIESGKKLANLVYTRERYNDLAEASERIAARSDKSFTSHEYSSVQDLQQSLQRVASGLIGQFGGHHYGGEFVHYGDRLPDGPVTSIYISPRLGRLEKVIGELDVMLAKSAGSASMKINTNVAEQMLATPEARPTDTIVVNFNPADTKGLDSFLRELAKHQSEFLPQLLPPSWSSHLTYPRIPLAPGVSLVERPNEHSWNSNMTSLFKGQSAVMDRQATIRRFDLGENTADTTYKLLNQYPIDKTTIRYAQQEPRWLALRKA